MGTLWFGCIMLYGSGAAHLGKMGTTIGWLILMAMTVLVGNLWGFISGEWKKADAQVLKKMRLGTIFLVSSVIIVGLSKLI